MNFGWIFRRKRNENYNLDEISKIKHEFEKEDSIFERELSSKYNLLQEFNIIELKNLCIEILGREPSIEYYNESKSARKELPNDKEDYVHFLVDELSLSQIIKYALKKKIVSKSTLKNYKRHDKENF